MDFDVTKVYTALNADELKIGSKCVFADTVKDLRQGVQSEDMDCLVWELTEIRGDGDTERFTVGDTNYLLAYLIEPPIEPNYCSFCNTETAFKIITAHGGWVKNKQGRHSFITAIDIGGEDECEIMIDADWVSNERLFRNYVFADDGSTCGELVEE